MKTRLKFNKYGSMKFVGHLDIMRYFQKAFRRSGIDVAYSQGFSPHQQMSFAAPLGVGLTSDGEYLDLELNTAESFPIMLNKINAVMADGIQVLTIKMLPQDSKNAMSIVAAADYKVSLKDGYSICEDFSDKFSEFMKQNEIVIMKKSKRTEKEVDIRPFIYHYGCTKVEFAAEIGRNLEHSVADTYENQTEVYLQLATGSVNNLKPELVIEAFCAYIQLPYQEFAFQIHRIEVYADKSTMEETENGIRNLITLDELGTDLQS